MTLPTMNPKRWLFLASFLPLLWLLLDIALGNLGANPIQALHRRLGDWTLRFLCVTLMITPLQKLTNWRGMSEYRQMFGLYSFFYGSLHLFGYLLVDQALVWPMIGMDILQSPYIWFGLLAYNILLLLAITSSNYAKKLMGKTWKKLHRYIYLAAPAAAFHYFWQLKGNLAQPFLYAMVIFILLAFRIVVWFKDRQLNRYMIPKSRK